MKQVIVLLGMIVLGIFMVNSVILGNTNSFKSDATTLGTEAKTQITEFVNDI